MLDDILQRNNLAMMNSISDICRGCHRADASGRLSMYMQVMELSPASRP